LKSKFSRRLAIFALGVLIVACLLAQGPHSVSGHFNTKAPDTDVWLRWPVAGSYSMSIDVKILNSPETNAAIYWGHQFQFANNETGYLALGLGETTKLVSFGIFDAVQGVPNNSSGICDNIIGFLTTGIGSACYLIYQWNMGRNYRLQVSRISDVNGSEQWQGSIFDYSSNSISIIGNILVSPAYGQLGTSSSTWDEYATAASCDTPSTSVIFSYPYALNSAGNHAPTQAEVTYGNSTCQDSNVQYLGGGAYQADAGKNVTRATPARTWLWTQEPDLVSQSQVSVPEFPFEGAPFVAFAAMTVVLIICFGQENRDSSLAQRP
jgi:hypothetical protein